jgi:hypothetical protein
MPGLTSDEVDARAAAPKRTVGDEGTVEERDAKDVIALDGYAKSPAGPPYGMRMARVEPRGTVG